MAIAAEDAEAKRLYLEMYTKLRDTLNLAPTNYRMWRNGGMRIIHGNIDILSDLKKKSVCVLYLGAYYTWECNILGGVLYLGAYFTLTITLHFVFILFFKIIVKPDTRCTTIVR